MQWLNVDRRPRTASGCPPPPRSCSATWRRRGTGHGTCSPCATCSSRPAASPSSCRCPFVHMEAPLYRRGRARPGPTWREARLMHAVARLVLHPLVAQHPGVLDEARRSRRRGLPAIRRQRPRRHADERVDLARRRRRPRPGTAAGADGRAGAAHRAAARASHDALPRAAGGAGRRSPTVRRRWRRCSSGRRATTRRRPEITLTVVRHAKAQARYRRNRTCTAPTATTTMITVMHAAAEPYRRDEPKIGRNDPCHCGSGKKYKKCHGARPNRCRDRIRKQSLLD